MNILTSILKIIRPKQWIKNFFVLGPIVFARELFDLDPLLATVKAFMAFCFMASAVYVINDIADVEADRRHPEKKHRPLAAGTMSTGQAYAVLFVLVVAVALLAIGMDIRFTSILVMYFVLNLAYSFKLKEIVLLDVFIIAAGFMMRVMAGAYAIDVELSRWIMLCTLFLSLFLGFAKRRAELVSTEESGTTSERRVLMSYRVGFLDQMLTISASATVISYALYTVAPRTLEVFGTDKMIYTTVFVLYGVFRYLYLIHIARSTENPTNAVTSDASIIAVVILWAVACIVLIYSGGTIPYISK
jgi:4-hydroxybenzoate polyprenyltransferase